MPRRDRRPSAISEFFGGVAFLFRGLKVWGTAPKLMVLGMIPALLVGAVFVAGIITLGVNLEGAAEFLTPFAASWDEPFRTTVRVLAGLALLAATVFLAINAYTTVTLIVGAPFYEQIWRHVERRFGEDPQSGIGWWSGFWRAVWSGLRILIPTILLAIGLFAIGFIPVVGQILVVVIGALVGGWFLALELTGLAFDGRGKTLSERRATLRTRRARSLGFGAAAYLTFLIPFGAVVMMPAAVAGGTLLSRTALGERITAPGADDRTSPERPR